MSTKANRPPLHASVALIQVYGDWFVRSVVGGIAEMERFASRKSAVLYAERQRTKLHVHRVIWLQRI